MGSAGFSGEREQSMPPISLLAKSCIIINQYGECCTSESRDACAMGSTSFQGYHGG